MQRILKRYLTRDPTGVPIAIRFERVADDDAGNVHFSDEQTARACTGCGRFVTEVDQSRGVCDVCHTRECCDHCVGRCQVCQRQLCGRCRCGFVGTQLLTVCEVCRQALQLRQTQENQRIQEQRAFERHIIYRRLVNEVEEMRLNAQRRQLSLQLQSTRLGSDEGRPSRGRWLLALLGRSAGWMVRYVYQHLVR